MNRRHVLAGWLIGLFAAAIMPLWAMAERIRENPLGRYVTPEGSWTADVYVRFFWSWLPIAVGVSVLAFACLFVDRRER